MLRVLGLETGDFMNGTGEEMNGYWLGTGWILAGNWLQERKDIGMIL